MRKKSIIHFDLTFDDYNIKCQAAYSEEGSGETLLMLHGFFLDETSWRPLKEQIKNKFRCISLDLLGFGESEKPDFSHYITAQATFVNEFLKKLKINKCYVVGYSFGAWVAVRYALKFPKQVKGLILVGAAGIKDEKGSKRFWWLKYLLWDSILVDFGLNLLTPIAVISNKTKELAKIKNWHYQLKNQPAARSLIINRMKGIDRKELVETEIHQLDMPTLVIAGECDETIPLWHSQTYAQKIPNAKLTIISDADHSLPQNYSQQIATSLLNFFASDSISI